MNKPSTPFPLTGYYGPSYFCDREDETTTLMNNIKAGRSMVLTARRRIGKTSLIMHVLSKLPKDQRGIYLDILPTENRNDFLNELATALVMNISEKKGFGKKAWDFIKSLRPLVTFDSLTGTPQVTFSMQRDDVNSHIETVLGFLGGMDEKFVVAIDEFQQILKYPEESTDAWLRTIIQRLKNVVFIFSGSQQHLMNDLFSLPSRPFYNSAGFLKINRIERNKYAAFIKKKFSSFNKVIDDQALNDILDWTDGHTFYVQLLCNRIFLSGAAEIKEEVWKKEAAALLAEHEPVFMNYRGMITLPQWNLLKAVALEGDLYEPTGNDFIVKHSLGSPATVLRSLIALLRMELIYYDYTPEGRKYHKINDLIFRRWVESRD